LQQRLYIGLHKPVTIDNMDVVIGRHPRPQSGYGNFSLAVEELKTSQVSDSSAF
jgi:hypothetical protein